MRIAVISDIHGNLEALKTVLDDIKNKNIDKIFCLGDIIAKGSHPVECIKLVKENCDVVIRGNCDEYFASDLDLSNKPDLEISRIKWNKSKLDNDSINYLLNLPYCYEFYMSGRLVRLLHAHPKKIDFAIGNVDRINNLYGLVLPSDNTISDAKADVLIFGHIHTPFVQKIYNRFIINPGSVGNAIDLFRNPLKDGDVRNTCVANYLILTGSLDSMDFSNDFSFEIVNIPYDIDKELENSEDNLELDSYSLELRNGCYRDMNKIYDYFVSRGIDKNDI